VRGLKYVISKVTGIYIENDRLEKGGDRGKKGGLNGQRIESEWVESEEG
jgi:hypothetical protein